VKPSECFDGSSDPNYGPRKFEQLIGNSRALEEVLEGVKRVAPTSSTVFIQGETGTGKELIARAIHNASPRCARPFIKLNCAAIPQDLLESELFGHEKGAFTGAIAQKLGRFELADKGTLFLDEVGDIPPALQPKLLRILQEHMSLHFVDQRGAFQAKPCGCAIPSSNHASPSHAPPLSAMSIQGNAKTPTRSECFPGEG
jgi:transcriptional regulator with GAF, ATPase, and Fis domain